MSFPSRMRIINKRILNRLTMRIAGLPHSPISVVRHVGRRSGKPYKTPIIVEPVADGFIFALTYGPEVDWYRNILAAGSCTVHWHGNIFVLEKPQPVDVKRALPAFPLPFRLILQVTRMRDFFMMVYQKAG